jgi:hypothetical protein
MLANTTCDVHTFDCTHKGHSIHPSRHTYHQWCVGQQGGQTRPWANITAELGHSEVQLLNMDIGAYCTRAVGGHERNGSSAQQQQSLISSGWRQEQKQQTAAATRRRQQLPVC